MVAVDARAPLYDGGIGSRIDCVSLGVVVNRESERFYVDGEDFWPKRYAIWGRFVAQQPGQIAYSVRRRRIHAGNVLGKGYTAGVGMSIGTAFRRIAGTQAARAALKEKPRATA